VGARQSSAEIDGERKTEQAYEGSLLLEVEGVSDKIQTK
jgi:hypothetical protein